MQLILYTLSDSSICVKYDTIGRLSLTNEASLSVKNDLLDLSNTWPGHPNSIEAKLISKLTSEGLLPKNLFRAYDGFVRRQEKK